MIWLICARKGVDANREQFQSRTQYIQQATGACAVSDWLPIQNRDCFCCTSNDGINGAFITAHFNDVDMLFELYHVNSCDFIVVNTCLMDRWRIAELRMLRDAMGVDMWIPRQRLFVMAKDDASVRSLISNNLLKDEGLMVVLFADYDWLGTFGFQTSLSERLLFKNRGKGFMAALGESFIKL